MLVNMRSGPVLPITNLSYSQTDCTIIDWMDLYSFFIVTHIMFKRLRIILLCLVPPTAHSNISTYPFSLPTTQMISERDQMLFVTKGYTNPRSCIPSHCTCIQSSLTAGPPTRSVAPPFSSRITPPNQTPPQASQPLSAPISLAAALPASR